MNIDRNKLTPMMKQYFEVKDRYPDCILFFRLGDFYDPKYFPDDHGNAATGLPSKYGLWYIYLEP